jgi:YtfJ family uncharacterized protein
LKVKHKNKEVPYETARRNLDPGVGRLPPHSSGPGFGTRGSCSQGGIKGEAGRAAGRKTLEQRRVAEALEKEKFPTDKFQSYGMINMAATWLPNFAISSALEEKQKKYPKTIYVRDYKKVLVQAWKIADDSSNVLVFDKKGKLIFRKDGKLTNEEIQKLIKVIRDNL